MDVKARSTCSTFLRATCVLCRVPTSSLVASYARTLHAWSLWLVRSLCRATRSLLYRALFSTRSTFFYDFLSISLPSSGNQRFFLFQLYGHAFFVSPYVELNRLIPGKSILCCYLRVAFCSILRRQCLDVFVANRPLWKKMKLECPNEQRKGLYVAKNAQRLAFFAM